MTDAVVEVLARCSRGEQLGRAVYEVAVARDMRVREAVRLYQAAEMTLRDVGPRLPPPARVPDVAAIERAATLRTRPTLRPIAVEVAS